MYIREKINQKMRILLDTSGLKRTISQSHTSTSFRLELRFTFSVSIKILHFCAIFSFLDVIINDCN